MKPSTSPVSDSTENGVHENHETNPFLTPSDTFKKQKDIYGWSLWDERSFIENLYNQRFNYLLVVYGLLLNILYRMDDKLLTFFFGLFGTVLLFGLWLMMNRIYCKLDICLKYLHNIQQDENNKGVEPPLRMSDLDKKTNSRNRSQNTFFDRMSVVFGKKAVLHYQTILSLMCILSLIFLVFIKIFSNKF